MMAIVSYVVKQTPVFYDISLYKTTLHFNSIAVFCCVLINIDS